jgi:ribosome maturation factor RimP
VPLFIDIMTFKEQVKQLLDAALAEKPTIFLTNFVITESNKIIVTLDGDNGVLLQDCMDVSRAIEHNLDREEIDFGLEVASVGIGTPLKMVRQYVKNIGRTLIVQIGDQTIEAILTAADNENITLSWEAREPKKIGKGKETVQKNEQISYEDIKEAIVTVTF